MAAHPEERKLRPLFLAFCRLELLQESPRPLYDSAWHTGEAGTLNAVRLAGTAGFERTKEHDAFAPFSYADVHIDCRGALLGEANELVVVSREDGPCLDFVMHRFRYCPGNGEAVKRAGPPPYLVQQNQ